MTDEQIKHMVDRFLSWKLPKNFNPDGGITAKRPNYAASVPWEPSGTNLLDAGQAEAMVRHMIEGMPSRKVEHASDCALNDAPAYPCGPCSCGASA